MTPLISGQHVWVHLDKWRPCEVLQLDVRVGERALVKVRLLELTGELGRERHELRTEEEHALAALMT